MKKIFLSIISFALATSVSAQLQPVTPPNITEILLLKVDYTTNRFEGGQKLQFPQSTETFTTRIDYKQPGDFGWIKVYFSEIDTLLFYGDIFWMGCGNIIYPAEWRDADEFEHVTEKNLIWPLNGFENIHSAWNEDDDYEPVWIAVQGIWEVRQILRTNPQQQVKLFLYTPSVGVGDPADWKWIIFLAGTSADGSTGIAADISASGAALFQSSPSPSGQSAVIRYSLPQSGKPARLVIGNTAGAIVRQIPLQSGTDAVTISDGALPAGVYYYSLYVGNRLIGTKKMILTKK
ncbi:MAG: hypothetical protein LBF08_07245 [Dysgonamonadaceae bacterium]|nr:hypothetical protein [Dysgonamonadaceae bacterium]